MSKYLQDYLAEADKRLPKKFEFNHKTGQKELMIDWDSPIQSWEFEGRKSDAELCIRTPKKRSAKEQEYIDKVREYQRKKQAKPCISEENIKQKADSKTKREAYKREYYLRNKEKINNRTKEWQKSNKEKINKHKRTYYTKHIEKMREYHKLLARERKKRIVKFGIFKQEMLI